MTNDYGMDRPPSEARPDLVGIAGWLTLPAIGLILGPIVGAVTLVILAFQYPDFDAAGIAGLWFVEMALGLALLAGQIYVAMRFFDRKADAPSAVVTLIVANLLAQLLLQAIERSVGASELAAATDKVWARSMLQAAIWIPYFRLSKRVKATFVH